MRRANRLLTACLAKADAKVLPFPPHARAIAAAARAKRGGPGSRGGHVLGTTKSGKPIYSHDHEVHDKIFKIGSNDHVRGGVTLPKSQAAAAVIRSHKGWSVSDHIEASDAHSSAANKHEDADVALHAMRVARAHIYAAGKLSNKS